MRKHQVFYEPCKLDHLTDADRAVLDAAEALVEADRYGTTGEYAAALMVLTRAVDRREAQSG